MKMISTMILLVGLVTACGKPPTGKGFGESDENEVPARDEDNEVTKVIGDSFIVLNPRISGKWVVANNTNLNVKYICEVRKRQPPPPGTGYVWETLENPINGVYVNISSIGGRTEIRNHSQNVIIREVHCLNRKLGKEISDF